MGIQSKRIDIAGLKFGRLTVIDASNYRNSDNRVLWNCICDCGANCLVAGRYLRSGLTKSCGCLHQEVVKVISITHGLSKSSTYQSWQAMKNRCYNKKQKSYANYGAIGIKVCPAWRDSFTAFLTEMGERPKGTTLDRKDPFGNYELGNCKWSTPLEQSRNTRGQMAIKMLTEFGLTTKESNVQ